MAFPEWAIHVVFLTAFAVVSGLILLWFLFGRGPKRSGPSTLWTAPGGHKFQDTDFASVV